ncbi:MAG: TadE/TadG family type IV pilus assembly protein [Vicinamibacterales bacterium]
MEAAFALPIFALVLVGTIDFGRLFYKTMAVTHAARAGVQYGTYIPGLANDDPGMESAALGAGSIDIPSGLTAAANHECFCYTGGAETSMICTAACGGQTRVYVTVTASATFTTVMNYPGIPNSVAIVRAARMRAK